MKQKFLLAASMAILLFASLQPLGAQVYSQFKDLVIKKNVPYSEVVANRSDYARSSFTIWGQTRPDQGYDDGYKYVQFPANFKFEYNSEVYDGCWISVNGFITFTEPPKLAVSSRDATILFKKAPNFPINVIAPFWGDHYYRSSAQEPGYVSSAVRTGWETVANNKRVFIIEWKNLNINDKSIPSSVATFQVRIYESTSPNSYQGDIEFCYGNINSTQGSTNVVKGSSVGLNGEFYGGRSKNGIDDRVDFINALYNDNAVCGLGIDPYKRRTEENLTTMWTPSGYNDWRIRFVVEPQLNVEEWWGDGDAGMSKAPGGSDYADPGPAPWFQNRWVSVNDARTIIRSIARNRPLDSIRRRAAFHGDANHNGRFYFKDTSWVVPLTLVIKDSTMKRLIRNQDEVYTDNLRDPLTWATIPSAKAVYFAVTEADASLILHYLAARVPKLPWLIDTIVRSGKVTPTEQLSSNIQIGDIRTVAENTYLIPIAFNGYSEGTVSGKFNINGEIVNIFNNASDDIMIDNNNSTFVFAGSGKFESGFPFINLIVKTDSKDINITDLRFNDNEKNPINIHLTEEQVNTNSILYNDDNPVTKNTQIFANIKDAGNYTITVIDLFGNKIKTITNGNLNAGFNQFEWNLTDQNGSSVPNGVYFYILNGENLTIMNKMVVAR
ncbi:MAG: FlgD ig protein [Ignavibacteria bacterium]|nr:FlgD ig protein [Ignavibacteria bacterium]